MTRRPTLREYADSMMVSVYVGVVLFAEGYALKFPWSEYERYEAPSDRIRESGDKFAAALRELQRG